MLLTPMLLQRVRQEELKQQQKEQKQQLQQQQNQQQQEPLCQLHFYFPRPTRALTTYACDLDTLG